MITACFFSESLLLTDPVLNNDNSYVLDRSRMYERSCQKSMHLLELVKKYNITNEEEITILERCIYLYFHLLI